MTAAFVDLSDAVQRDLPALLALNASATIETSELDTVGLVRLLETSLFALATPDATAMLIALDQSAVYDSPNFQWFRARYARFVYVDRVIVAASVRGRGTARQLYVALFAAADASLHTRVVCEVNVDPPNPASDAFHASFGFAEVGRATLANGKTVRYLECAIGGTASRRDDRA